MQEVRGVSNGRRLVASARSSAASPNGWMGQWEPRRHPATRRPPEEALGAAGRVGGAGAAELSQSGSNERICGRTLHRCRSLRSCHPYMTPATRTVCAEHVRIPQHSHGLPGGPGSARARLHSFAPPRASAFGDAHEWEGAAAGQLLPPDYPFDRIRGIGDVGRGQHECAAPTTSAMPAPRGTYSIGSWRAGVCATGSSKTASVHGGS